MGLFRRTVERIAMNPTKNLSIDSLEGDFRCHGVAKDAFFVSSEIWSWKLNF